MNNLKTMLSELVNGILAVMYGRVIKIILYGSTARGTRTPESDIDVAVIFNDLENKHSNDRLSSISDLIVDLNLKYDAVLSVIDIDEERFKKLKNILPFYKNIDNEGIILWKKI